MLLPTGGLVVLTVVIGVAAGPLLALANRAAADLLDPSGYIDAVLHR
jgi:multicomponent Na+:H+ antiporter subunit D